MRFENFYDVVIIGGRIAGASSAILLARAGLKVAVVEPSPLGSNTLSTHFLWPRALAYFDALKTQLQVSSGYEARRELNYALNGVKISGAIPKEHIDRRISHVHRSHVPGIKLAPTSGLYACIRRQYLDAALIEAAVEAGADLFIGSSMQRIERGQQGDVHSISISGKHGNLRLRGNVFIAADGRSSPTAAKLGVPYLDYRKVSTASAWSYYSGIPAANVRLAKNHTSGFGAATTNDGLTMVLVWGAQTEAATYLKQTDDHFLQTVAAIDPEFADTLAAHGTREERFYSVSALESFKRPGVYQNVLFAGDAVCFKDQCTASGILHAFRDAYLASEVILTALDSNTLTSDLAEYAARRELDTADYFEFACQAATMLPPTQGDINLVRHCMHDPILTADFLSAASDSLPMTQFTTQLATQSFHTGATYA